MVMSTIASIGITTRGGKIISVNNETTGPNAIAYASPTSSNQDLT